jgi:hypothetical protein
MGCCHSAEDDAEVAAAAEADRAARARVRAGELAVIGLRRALRESEIRGALEAHAKAEEVPAVRYAEALPAPDPQLPAPAPGSFRVTLAQKGWDQRGPHRACGTEGALANNRWYPRYCVAAATTIARAWADGAQRFGGTLRLPDADLVLMWLECGEPFALHYGGVGETRPGVPARRRLAPSHPGPGGTHLVELPPGGLPASLLARPVVWSGGPAQVLAMVVVVPPENLDYEMGPLGPERNSWNREWLAAAPTPPAGRCALCNAWHTPSDRERDPVTGEWSRDNPRCFQCIREAGPRSGPAAAETKKGAEDAPAVYTYGSPGVPADVVALGPGSCETCGQDTLTRRDRQCLECIVAAGPPPGPSDSD